MFLSKVKFAAIAVLAIGFAGSGAGFLAHQTNAGQAKLNAAAPAPAQATNKSHVLADKLKSAIDYPGLDDPKATLNDALDHLAKRYGLKFDINKRAFEIDQLKDVARTPIAEEPIPPMKTTLATVLHRILVRVPASSGATYLIRRDLIEITTEKAVRSEMGIPAHRPLLPLVCETLGNSPIDAALRKLADETGYSIVIDPRIADKLRTPATAAFNNLPLDTAVRLLANLAGQSAVRLDSVLFVTTADNAKSLREEQANINAEKPAKCTEAPKKPAK